MTPDFLSTANLAELHPSIRAMGHWSGFCELGGRLARIALVDDLLQIRVPASGESYALHVRQPEHAGLSKLVPGSYLRAEAPCGTDPTVCFEVLRDDLTRAVDLVETDRPGPTPQSSSPAPDFDLAGLVHSITLEASRNGDGFSFALEGDDGHRTATTIEPIANCIACRTVLCHLGDVPDFVRYALSHFLLALNERLRVARASLLPDRVLLEACIPFALASPRFLEQVIEALSVGSRVARRESAALRDPNLAHEYLQMHWKGD